MQIFVIINLKTSKNNDFIDVFDGVYPKIFFSFEEADQFAQNLYKNSSPEKNYYLVEKSEIQI